MERYYVWWPWLTTKCVARVCQHKLSFLLYQAVHQTTSANRLTTDCYSCGSRSSKSDQHWSFHRGSSRWQRDIYIPFLSLCVRLSVRPTLVLCWTNHQTTRWVTVTGPRSAKWQNFVTSGPIFIFFTVKFRKALRRTVELNYHITSNLLMHYLATCKWSTVQLYSTVNSVLSDKMFNYGKCSWGMLFLRFSTQINLRPVFKMFAFGTNVCFESWMPLVNGCVIIVRCSMMCQTFIFITARND